jgi:hypothetical protein
MFGVRQPSIRGVVHKQVRDSDCLRRLVAHNALRKQLKSRKWKPPSPSIDRRRRASAGLTREHTALGLLIEKLILDDLAEQERLNAIVGE